MKFAGTTTADPNLGEYQAMLKFEELVEKYSNNSIDVQVYPASQLGGSVEFTEAVGLGEVESCMVGFDGLGNLQKEMYALCMPYLYTDNDQLRPILEGDTAARKAIDESLAKVNMEIVGISYRPFRVMANNKHAVKSPADLKGIAVRSPSSAANTAIIQALGANPTTISWSEVFTSMQQGACDGVENAITELYSINLQEATKYVSETNHMAAPIPIVVCKSWFDGLTADQQSAIQKAGQEVTDWRAENVKEEEATAWKAFADAGAQCLRMKDIDLAAFQDACKDVYKQFVKDGYFTEEFYNALKS
jgi:tripartite ATP-independent transporter DctP family solute receptor